MDRTIYIIAIAASLLFFGIYILIARKKVENRMQKTLMPLHYGAFFIILSNLFIAISQSKKAAEISHGMYFIAMDWFLFGILMACVIYTHAKYAKQFRWFGLLLVIDTINIIANFWLKHCFTVEAHEKNGYIAYKLVQLPMYHIHLIICYIMVALFLALLIYRTIQVPLIYGTRYLFIIVATAVVVIVDGIYLLLKLDFDWSVLSYAVLSIVGSYLIQNLVPKNLLHRTQSMVVDGLSTGLIIFDSDGNCLFVNNYVSQYFHQTEDELFADHGLMYFWRKKHGLTLEEEKEFLDEFNYNGEKKHYRLSFQKYYDEKHKFIGSYILIQDITSEIKRAEEDHIRATRDELTGLYNRRYFIEKAEALFEERGYKDYMLVCSDITNFKMLNELYGSESGDEILKNFGKFIITNATDKGTLYGKIGGDDFAMFLPKELFREALFIKLAKEVMEPVNRDKQFQFICRIGVVEVTEKMDIGAMCDRAQLVINEIKDDYNKIIGYYDESLKNRMIEETEMNSNLDKAIKNGELCIFIQPQVDEEGRTLGGECLVRWISEEKGMLSPMSFIPIFEKNGRIAEMDKHVWRLACEKLKDWQRIGRTDLYLSINISAKDIILLDVYKELTSLVEEYKISPELLRLEITESVVMEDLNVVKKLTSDLQDYGFIVEMDDFGSGYSSLNMLKEITIDVVKLDMKFLQKSENPEKSKVIIKSVAELIRLLNMEVLVEGVETSQQLEYLKEIGCGIFQGYYFAKPLPVVEFETRVGIS